MNAKELRAIMVLNGDTYSDLANALGISEASLGNKINEKGTEFKQGEIARIKDRYSLTPEQVESIFFA